MPVPRPHIPADRGQTTVELALCLPILLTVLLAIYQFGIVWDKAQNLAGAAREGARAAAIADTPADADTDARAAVRDSYAITPPPSFRLERPTLAGAPAYRVELCTPFDISILGVVARSGTLCRAATFRAE